MPALPTVSDDYDKRLRDVRSRSGLSQDALARRIGAASKAVVLSVGITETKTISRSVAARP